MKAKSMAKRLYQHLADIKGTLSGIVRAADVSNAASYNPDQPRKSSMVRWLDNVRWSLKYHELNRFYNLYNMDLKGHACVNNPEYIDYLTFYRQRNSVNSLSSLNDNHIIILRDKHLMNVFFHQFGIQTPEIVGLVYNGRFYDNHWKACSLEDIIQGREVDYFLKKTDGECADGVFHITSAEQLKTFSFKTGKYILQERLIQHPAMNKLWDGAINTCRICTLYDGKCVSILSSVLRVGTSVSAPVDNWAHGGISVGVHEDGSLVEYGVYKPGYGGKAYEHPDTHIRFSDFVIPEYDKAIDLCKRAHLALKEIPAIGWDIAITPDGPTIIEGNDNWEISLMQASNHGLKKEWDKFMRNYRENTRTNGARNKKK